MELAAESTELVPKDSPNDEDRSAESRHSPPAPLSKRLREKIATVKWREFLTTSIIVVDLFLLYMSISQIGVFFPTEANGKGVSIFVTGVIIGITPLAVTIFAPLIGYLLPILRIPFSILTGLIVVGGVYVSLGFAIYLPSGWPFIVVCVVLRFIEGIGTALFLTAGYTLITSLYPESTGFVVGIAEIGSGVGYTCGPVIGGFLYKAGGYKLPFFSVGGLYFVLCIPVFIVLIGYSDKSTKQLLHLKVMFGLLKNFTIFLLVVAVILQMAGFGFLGATYSLFLEEQFGLTPDKIGLVFLAGSVPYALFAPISGAVADKVSPRFIVLFGLLLAGVGYGLLGPTPLIPVNSALWLSIIGDIMLGTGAGQTCVAAFPDISKITLKTFPELLDSESERMKVMGIIAGMISSAMSFGEFIGPIIGGGLTDLTDFRTSSAVFSEFLIALMVVLLVVSIINSIGKRDKASQENGQSKTDSEPEDF